MLRMPWPWRFCAITVNMSPAEIWYREVEYEVVAMQKVYSNGYMKSGARKHHPDWPWNTLPCDDSVCSAKILGWIFYPYHISKNAGLGKEKSGIWSVSNDLWLRRSRKRWEGSPAKLIIKAHVTRPIRTPFNIIRECVWFIAPLEFDFQIYWRACVWEIFLPGWNRHVCVLQ